MFCTQRREERLWLTRTPRFLWPCESSLIESDSDGQDYELGPSTTQAKVNVGSVLV